MGCVHFQLFAGHTRAARVKRFIIYLHTNRVTGRGYIGQTCTTMWRRWKQHVWDARHNQGPRAFARAIRKHGADVWDHQILDVVTSQEGANIAERVWIKQRRTLVPNGYNLSEGGRNFTTHPTTRKRIGDASRARYAAMTPEQRHQHGLKVQAARTPEERVAIAKRRSAAWTPEQRSNMLKKAWANATPEQRATRIKNARAALPDGGVWATLSQEQRAAAIEKGNAARATARANTPAETLRQATEKRRAGLAAWRASFTPEQWREHEKRRMEKAWTTRRSKKS
jgi:hypothetical protein